MSVSPASVPGPSTAARPESSLASAKIPNGARSDPLEHHLRFHRRVNLAGLLARLDTATKGYYSGRLQFLAVVAILALTAAGTLFANVNSDWIRWM